MLGLQYKQIIKLIKMDKPIFENMCTPLSHTFTEWNFETLPSRFLEHLLEISTRHNYYLLLNYKYYIPSA